MSLSGKTPSCVIRELLDKKCKLVTSDEKRQFTAKGRPMPAMKSLVWESKRNEPHKKSFVRHFNVKEYKRFPWLTGSEEINRLFCWPCLIFSPVKTVWNVHGYADLHNLYNAMVTHNKAKSHVSAFLEYTTIGRSRVDVLKTKQQRVAVERHNLSVKNNRKILRRLINCVCLMAKLDMPVYGNDENKTSMNSRIYMEFVETLGEYDQLLNIHLQSTTGFKGTSSHVLNSLIKSLENVVLRRIKDEVAESSYVAIILHDTSDVKSKSQMSTVLRYVDNNGETQERLVSYGDVTSDKTAESVFKHVVNVVEEYLLGDKLIAQSYDGYTVLPDHLQKLCSQVQEQYPTALLVNSCDHKLGPVLEAACSSIKECHLFFATLSGLSQFFSESERCKAFQTFMSKVLPNVAPKRWLLTSPLLNIVSQFLSQFILFFDSILDNPKDWDVGTIVQAQGYKLFLTHLDNHFLLQVFGKLFGYTNKLDKMLTTKSFDISESYQKMLATKALIICECDSFDELWEELKRQRGDFDPSVEPPTKRKCVAEEVKDWRSIYGEIIAIISNQISVRYDSMKQLEFVDLLNREKFSGTFPEQSLNVLLETYPGIFNIENLRSELIVGLYGDPDFRNKPIHKVVSELLSLELASGVPELYKLVILYLTIPVSKVMAVEDTDELLSARERIKYYELATQGQSKPSNMSVLSIEKNLLYNLKHQKDFHANVIEEFLQLEGRDEFTFK